MLAARQLHPFFEDKQTCPVSARRRGLGGWAVVIVWNRHDFEQEATE
jgi:hypothetical protein